MGENYYDAMARAEDEREAFAAKDAEIERLKADREHLITMLANTTNDLRAALARVRGQRDRLAIDMKHSIHADRLFCGSSDAKRESAEIMESEYGLRIESGEVKEIEGS